MSLLSDKYKIPEPTIKNMISDGVIASTWSTYDEVNRLHKEGKTTTEISDLTRISVRYVQKILARTK